MMLGIAVALPLYALVGPDKKFVAFALFMGVAMSITAFPVLARILVERRMLKRPVGALALACAAIDDVTAWFLIALATAVAVGGRRAATCSRRSALAIAFCLVHGRWSCGRCSAACRPPTTRPAACPAAGSPRSSPASCCRPIATEEIGIALIFGAFIMGMIMPRHAGLTEDVTHRIEDFVVIAAAAAVLRLHRPAHRTSACSTGRSCGCITGRADRRGDRRQAVRRDDRRAAHRLRLARLGRDRHADEHARPDRADRAQPRAREGRDLRRAVRVARDHGAGHHVHGGAAAQAARPEERATARRSRRSSRRRATQSQRSSSRTCRSPERSILVAPQSETGARAAAGARRAARAAPSRRAS